MSRPVLAIDTETHLFSPGNMAPPIVCMSYATTIKHGLLVDKPLIQAWLTDHLRMAIKGDIVITGHHVAYDMACILNSFPELWALVFKAYDEDGIVCTETREKLLDIATGEFKHCITEEGRKVTEYSLAGLSERRLGTKLQKEDTWRLRYKELDGVPLEQWPAEAKDYAIKDSVTALQLYEHQQARAQTINYAIPTQFDDTRADFALKLMSVWGVTTDTQYVRTRWNDTINKMNALATELHCEGVLSVSPLLEMTDEDGFSYLPDTHKSTKAIQELVKKSFPGDPPKTTKGAIKTDADTVRQCTDPLLIKIQEFKHLEKGISTYLKPFRQSIIHSSFYSVGATNDRTASDKPNLQNPPRETGFRECIIPRPGCKLIAVDLDAHEMRTLAQACLDIVGRSTLADKFNADPEFDPHADFANTAGLERQATKAANFGYPGGLSARTFVDYARGYGVNVTLTESEEIKESWFRQWPEIRDYFKHVSSLVGSENYGVQTIPGSGFRRKGVDYKQAANGYFSSLAAHASKDALWEVTLACYCRKDSLLYGSRPVLYLHDEVIIEAPAEYAEAIAKEMVVLMEKATHRHTPDIPSRAGYKIMDRWSK